MKTIIFVLIMNLLFAFTCLAEDSQIPDSTLIDCLQHKNVGIRSSAAQLLGERKSNKATDPLIKMLTTEKHPGIRVVISTALWKIGDTKVLSVLQKIAKKDKNKTVRKIAKRLIVHMQNK